MSLLTLSLKVVDEVGLPRPAAIATGTEQLARQMFALSNAVLEDLADKDWPVLTKSYEFQTVVGQDEYDLPQDWFRNVADTTYLASQYYVMRGSMTAAQWQRERNSLPSALGRYQYRVTGDPLKIKITPTPQTVENVVLEYISAYRVKNSNGDGQQEFSADSDYSVLPEDLVRKGLKWRIKHAKGLDYSEDYNEYEMSKATRLSQQLDSGSIPVAYRYPIDIPELPDGYIPEFGFGA